VVPYLELLIKNELVEIVEGEHLRYSITPRGRSRWGTCGRWRRMPEMEFVEEGLA
jgi:predicted transcriptional regulator